MAEMRDPLLEQIETAKEQSVMIANILNEIRHNEEQFSRFCNDQLERQQLEPQLDQFNQQVLNFSTLMGQFRELATNKLTLLTNAVEQLATEKIAVWKHEKQRSASGINMFHSITLEQLQGWCIPIAELIWELYLQLQEVERILHKGVIQAGNANYLPFVENATEDVVTLIQRFLSHALVVEEQPQIIPVGIKLAKRLAVSLLTGRSFNFHINPPELLTSLIDVLHARGLSNADNIAAAGEVMNGKMTMTYEETGNRLGATFNNMRVTSITRKRVAHHQPVFGQKYCFHLSFTMTLASRTIRVSTTTTSLPVVVISHGSRAAYAAAIIWWDNAFAPMSRESFEVRQTAHWTEIVPILEAKYREATEGHELTEDNLAYLARKAFRNVQPQPETISFDSLCDDSLHPLPGVRFSFWTWFHGILKLIERAHLKEMCRAGLIMGFIDRESAETLVASGGPGTFLLRFLESDLGGISIVVACYVEGQVIGRSLIPLKAYDLQRPYNLPMRIRERESLERLYQVHGSIPKDVAFGPFYNEEPILF